MSLFLKNGFRNLAAIRRASSAAARQAPVVSDQDNLRETELSNGFRVVSYTNQKNVATVGLWIDSGSRYEHSDNNGVASLFEHLLYTGTKNRDAQQLQNQLAKLGASLNSHTTRDQTAYYVECLSGDVEKVVEILADVVQNTNFSSSQVEEQKSVLLSKIAEGDSNIREVVLDNLHKTAFQGNPYSLLPYGSKSAVESLTKKDVEEFVQDHYKASRMVLAGVGGVDSNQLARLAEKHFGNVGNTYDRKMPDPRSLKGVRFTGSEIVYRIDQIHQLYGALAVEGVPRAHADYLPLLVASQAVGQFDTSMSARVNQANPLVQRSVGNNDLHYFENFSFNYAVTGLFGFQFCVNAHDSEKVYEFIKPMLNRWNFLAQSSTNEEVAQAVRSLANQLFTEAECNTALANRLATDVLCNRGAKSLSDLLQELQQINVSRVREAMSRNVYDREIAVSVYGATEGTPDYNMIRSAMSWWRL